MRITARFGKKGRTVATIRYHAHTNNHEHPHLNRDADYHAHTDRNRHCDHHATARIDPRPGEERLYAGMVHGTGDSRRA